MSGIVCAIRGGPHSEPTISRAISLAQETGLPLYFLYVVNLDFLSYTSSSRTHTISQEMRDMGEFILLSAQSRAQQAGIPAQGIVRQGNVSAEIAAVCRQVEADYLVLGRPHFHKGDTVFTEELLAQFILLIEEQVRVPVVMPDEEGEPA